MKLNYGWNSGLFLVLFNLHLHLSYNKSNGANCTHFAQVFITCMSSNAIHLPSALNNIFFSYVLYMYVFAGAYIIQIYLLRQTLHCHNDIPFHFHQQMVEPQQQPEQDKSRLNNV